MSVCVRCGHDLKGVKIFRQTTCPGCDAYLHACVQCLFYVPHASNQCREPSAERVAARLRANLCDYWKPTDRGFEGGDGGGGVSRADAARAGFDSLFKKSGE